MNYNYCCIHKQRTHEKLSFFHTPFLFHLAEKLVTLYCMAEKNVMGIKENVMREIEMPEDSDPFQDGTVLKEAFDRLNKYVVG